jgi:gp16 family phage-associated protein
MDNKTPCRTREEAKQWLERHGVSVLEWSRANGFDPQTVYALLSGQTSGKRGQAYRVAVALGIKEAPEPTEPHPLKAAV